MGAGAPAAAALSSSKVDRRLGLLLPATFPRHAVTSAASNISFVIIDT